METEFLSHTHTYITTVYISAYITPHPSPLRYPPPPLPNCHLNTEEEVEEREEKENESDCYKKNEGR